MITNLFLNVIAISISTSLIIVLLLIFTPFLNKRYAIKWKVLMWAVIAVRLMIPFHMDIPFPQMVIDVPTEITVPIDTNHESDAPTMSPAEQKPIEVNHGNTIKEPPQTARKPLKFTLLDITAYLWLAGCLLFLSVHIFSFLHYKRRITQKGTVVKERHILQQVCKISGKLQIKPNIRILRYKDAESPMVIGFLKPMLVLTDCDYSEEELFFILKHELIHIERHDIYLKLLFVIANALHWFNPLVYIMQREAVVDMELSCDEKVIQQTAFAVRKAYTETLFSSFSKQHKKRTFLSTQFYGGKKIMKKRFKNILTKSPKKNGLLVCIGIICITLISGMLIGCSAIKSDLPEESVQIDLDNTKADKLDRKGTEGEDNEPSPEGDLADDKPQTAKEQYEEMLANPEVSEESCQVFYDKMFPAAGLQDGDIEMNVLTVRDCMQQTEYMSGAAVVQQTLTYLTGKSENQEEIWEQIKDEKQDAAVGDKLRDYLNSSQDVTVYGLKYPASASEMRDDIFRSLDAGIPVILLGKITKGGNWAYDSEGGHFLNITGINNDGTLVEVTDPWIKWVDEELYLTGKYWITLEEAYEAVAARGIGYYM